MKILPKKLRDTDALNKITDGFKQQFAAAEKISDPADRVEAMLALQDSISSQTSGVSGAMAYRSSAIELYTLLPVTMASVLGGLVMCAAGLPFIGVPLIVASSLGSTYISSKGSIRNGFFNRMQKEAKGHFDALNDVAGKTSADIEQLLKTSSTEIAASEKFGSIYDRFPLVRDSFLKAFNQAVARKELSAAPAPKPAATGSAPSL